jgi:hypothetical protein
MASARRAVALLTRCGDNLHRENLFEQAAHK